MKQISNYPEMIRGSLPYDSKGRKKGPLVLSEDEKNELLTESPWAEKFIRRYITGKSLINYNKGKKEYALYLKNALPSELDKSNIIKKRLIEVKNYMLSSTRDGTYKMADFPMIFGEDRYIEKDMILIPVVSSGNREYVPVALMSSYNFGSGKVFQIYEKRKIVFALLNSKMHMAWLDTIGRKYGPSYSYSNRLVYNNFVIPELDYTTEEKLTQFAEEILDIRESYFKLGEDLADLYNPRGLPLDLKKAHSKLDKYVDGLYNISGKSFKYNTERVKRLLKLYEEKPL